MIVENIVEICVAIDIAILGIAYPIIVDKISNIGDKYSSEYLSVLFNNEFPQKSLFLNIYKWNFKFDIPIFKLTLFFTIIAFIALIFNQEPLFGYDNWFINNSAKLIVFVLTSFLTIFFFKWLDYIFLYNGKSTSLLKHIIAKYNALKDNNEMKHYYLKSINELCFYSVDKQDEHLQKTLLEFYYQEFKKIRRNHDKSIPLIYPIDLYFLVNNLNEELHNNKNRKLQAIEHRAVSGLWLLGEDFEEISISEETYNWLWRNLYIICENEKFVRMYWANVNQYFDFRLRNIQQNYDFERGALTNEIEVKKRENERNDFIEFHFALGGLLLYRKQYSTIKYIFEYSQSLPPKYVLLPESMTIIFEWFESFRNEFKNRKTPIDVKFYFPELDNLGNRRQVNYWICSYLVLLFIRQYSLNSYYVYQQFTSPPNLPDDLLELNNWLDSITYFEICLKDILENQALLQELKFEKIVTENIENIKGFIPTLREAIKTKIGTKKLESQLSPVKIEEFETTTNSIISDAFNEYKDIYNKEKNNEIENDLKFSVNGEINLITKSAFTDDDIPHMNYDSIFASHIAKNNIQRYIPNSFLVSRTKRYLLNKDNILEGLNKIIGSNKNVIIIGVNIINYELNEIISKSKYLPIIKKIRSSEYEIQDVLYVMNKTDLPFIEFKNLQKTEIDKLQLKIINDNFKIYTSIIDINKPENIEIKDNWKLGNNEDNLDLKVQVTIAFLAIIYWKKKRDVVQISIASQFKEQGIQSDISELEILRDDDVKKASH